MQFFLALTPIILILALMAAFRWGASRSGGAGYILTLSISIIFFGANLKLLAYAHMKALLLSLDVLMIVWAAFLLYRVADEAGAIKSIGTILPNLTADKGMQSLLIGWVFASFLQGVGGFGVPVAVIAPILVGIGFTPLLAVVLPSIGHGWAVTFGSLGSSFNALIATTGLPSEELAPPAAIFLGIACIITGWLVAYASGGKSNLKKLFIPSFFVGLSMAIGQYIAATTGLWNIAAFVGSIFGLIVIIAIITIQRAKARINQNGVDWKHLLMALSNYIVLIVIILVVQLVPGVKPFLSQIKLKINFPEIQSNLGYTTPAGAGRTISIFSHAGMLLLYASIIGYLIYKKMGLLPPGSAKKIFNETFNKMTGSSISILSMVSLAVIMEHTGMTNTLAEGISTGLHAIFPFVAPWIGAIGAFMTGSNTNSNVVFSVLQMKTALLLQYPVIIILAGQTAGAAVASVAAPTKMVVGASTAGMSGREGEVLRALVGYTLILILSISIITTIAIAISGL
ncbi:L-lactate permease [bacterium]|nr:L-lactate permease [bacterium]